MNDTTRILVTRSGPEGQALAARITGFGLPVSRYAPVQLEAAADSDTLRRQLMAALPVDGLIVPSAAALRVLASLVKPDRLQPAWMVVPGSGTAAKATALGFAQVVYPPVEGSSERMLALPELAAVAGRRILILAAEGGRGLIKETLYRRGADVKRLHLYRRVPVDPEPALLAELLGAADLVTLLASGGALAGLKERLPAAAWQIVSEHPVIAPSVRVARLAEAAGCLAVSDAGGADDAALLSALLALRPKLPAMR